MIVAVPLIVASGYFIVRGLLGERERLPALSLGTALAWSLFVVLLNLAVRAGVPFGAAAWLAGGGVAALGALGWRCASPGTWDRLDLGLLMLIGAPASLVILLYQFFGVDADYNIHYPLIGMFLRGTFPHVHPFFPDLPMGGHYGRDLGLAGLLSFGRIGIGSAMIVEAWVLHLSTLGNIYFLGKRHGGGRAAGAVAAAFAFFAVNVGFSDWVIRSGLAEVAGNNNPVIHAFLFAILLLASQIVADRRWMAVVFLGLLLGGFDAVYETHFAATACALAVLATAAWLPPVMKRWGRRPAVGLTAALALSFVVMLLSGGLVARKLRGADAPPAGTDPAAWAEAGAKQQVGVGFPKRPLLTATHPFDGRPIPVLGLEFLGAQGVAFWALPISALAVLRTRRIAGGVCLLTAAAALAAATCFDFGRFNSDTFRFLFLAGLMAAVCFGLVIGDLAGRLKRPRIAGGMLAVLVFACSGEFLDRLDYLRTIAIDHPHLLRIFEAARFEQWCPPYEEVDGEATLWLRGAAERDDTMASNFLAPDQTSGNDLIFNSAILMSRAHLPMVGFNLRLSRESGGFEESVSGWSGRATAYWATGDDELLRDLGADWLYVVPAWLPPGVAERMAASPALEERHRAEGRIVYRVDPNRLAPRPTERSDVTVTGFAMTGTRDAFVKATLTVRAERAVQGRFFIGYRIFDVTVGAPYDERDSVGTVHALRIDAGGEATIEIPFVVPYHAGEYEVGFFSGPTSLGTTRIRVE